MEFRKMKYLRLFEETTPDFLKKEIEEWFSENYTDIFKLFRWGLNNFEINKNKLTFVFSLTEPYSDGFELYNIQLNLGVLSNILEDDKDDLMEYLNKNYDDCIDEIEIEDPEEVNDAGNISHNYKFTLFFYEDKLKEIIRSSKSNLWGMKTESVNEEDQKTELDDRLDKEKIIKSFIDYIKANFESMEDFDEDFVDNDIFFDADNDDFSYWSMSSDFANYIRNNIHIYLDDNAEDILLKIVEDTPDLVTKYYDWFDKYVDLPDYIKRGKGTGLLDMKGGSE